LAEEFAEKRAQCLCGHFITTLNGVVAVDQNLGLDHRCQARFLAQGRITRQGVRVRVDTAMAGDAVTDRDHSAPFGEARAHAPVLRQTVTQTIKTLSYLFAGVAGQVLGTLVDFNAGYDTDVGEMGREGCAGQCLVSDGFIEKDGSGDELRQPVCRHQHIPIGAPTFLGAREAYGLKSFDTNWHYSRPWPGRPYREPPWP